MTDKQEFEKKCYAKSIANGKDYKFCEKELVALKEIGSRRFLGGTPQKKYCLLMSKIQFNQFFVIQQCGNKKFTLFRVGGHPGYLSNSNDECLTGAQKQLLDIKQVNNGEYTIQNSKGLYLINSQEVVELQQPPLATKPIWSKNFSKDNCRWSFISLGKHQQWSKFYSPQL